jgi:hypothetical protein
MVVLREVGRVGCGRYLPLCWHVAVAGWDTEEEAVERLCVT